MDQRTVFYAQIITLSCVVLLCVFFFAGCAEDEPPEVTHCKHPAYQYLERNCDSILAAWDAKQAAQKRNGWMIAAGSVTGFFLLIAGLGLSRRRRSLLASSDGETRTVDASLFGSFFSNLVTGLDSLILFFSSKEDALDYEERKQRLQAQPQKFHTTPKPRDPAEEAIREAEQEYSSLEALLNYQRDKTLQIQRDYKDDSTECERRLDALYALVERVREKRKW